MNKFEVDDIVVFYFPPGCGLPELSKALNGKKGKILTKRNTSIILGEFTYTYIVAFDKFSFIISGNDAKRSQTVNNPNCVLRKPFYTTINNLFARTHSNQNKSCRTILNKLKCNLFT